MILAMAGLRQLTRHPWQALLALVGVALGVGVVTAVDLANESAQRAFRFAAQTIGGKATHFISGTPQGLPDQLYVDLRLRRGIRRSAPVVEGQLQVPGAGTLRIVGIDPFAETPFRSFGLRFPRAADIASFLTRPATGLLLYETAVRLKVRQGDSFTVESGGERHRLLVTGFLEPENEVAKQGLQSVVVTDIATAQELLGMVGRLSRIDLIMPEGREGEQKMEQIRSLLPPGAEIIPAASRLGNLQQMTRAFRLNLTALSLLALVVGMFLIYNTMTFSVVRRRRFIGLLRAVGVTRREIFTMLCGEALVIGILGTMSGILLGTLLGTELTRLVTRTINDLYFSLEVVSVTPLPGTFLKASFLGVGATMLAAFPPALEATTTPPRTVVSRITLETRMMRLVPFSGLAGLLFMGAGSCFLLVERSGVIGGFTGLFFIIVGYALLVPAATVTLSRLFRPFISSMMGVVGKMAARGVVASISRTGVATAALVVAVSATLGIGAMVDSFRSTVVGWLDSWLRADVYVTTAGTGTGRNKPPLDPESVELLGRVSGASAVSLTRRISIEGSQGPTEVLAMEVPKETYASYHFREGGGWNTWGAFSRGEVVMVSEPYAYRHRLRVGESISLRTAEGVRRFPVAGVFYDYGSDAGVVLISRAAYIRFWKDPSVDGMGFYAEEGVAAGELAKRLRQPNRLSTLLEGVAAGELAKRLRESPGSRRVMVVENRELRKATLNIFDRTFAITGVLRLLTVTVAFVGILSALMAIQLERSRELAVLRAVGMTPRQAWGMIFGETGLIGIIAGLLSIPLGMLQALALVYVINRRSFGWTMQFSFGYHLVAEALILSMAAALLAGIYPARTLAGTSPALALKEE
ncbi:FtsX-like permease family protein [Geobacter sp. DSM 9736]|uniref:ABC transporter permease n=1 Tax=Geobacter sp. DSM 9736 TaxID=1277350 RepID=UPI000B504E0C|nr:FtsX-like permease family protein [Geobacter sp. DSM 9736]SNB45992.1 putative ABC transport system permease protein [Geobacter sp. DSM 9736]